MKKKSKSVLDMKRLPLKVLLTVQIGVHMIYYDVVQAEVKVLNLYKVLQKCA